MVNKKIRIFDVFFSILILLFFFPLIITISILIFIIDGSPIIYKQERIGYNGNPFIILKFRTMKNKILKNEYLRLFFFGKFLRKTSLDELPQLLNVLKRDMSLVGPRPLPVDIEKKISRKSKIKRRKVLPGITGLSQLKFTGKNRKLIEKVKLDLKFIDNYNVVTYFKILLKTPLVIVLRFFKNKSSIIK